MSDNNQIFMQLRIGVRAVFDWCEETYMAVSLLEMVQRFGLRASLFSTRVEISDPANESVHHRWDNLALCPRPADFEAWLKSTTHIIWFEVRPEELKKARKLGRRNILVVQWRNITDEQLKYLDLYDVVVCPSQASYAYIRSKGTFDNLVCTPWDSGLPIGGRLNAPAMPGEKRLLVIADKPISKAWGASLFCVVDELLAADPTVKVTVMHLAPWHTWAQKASDKLLEQYPDRIIDMPQPCALERQEAALVHDWVWIAAEDDNAAALVAERLVEGRPVIAFDSVPCRELITEGINGVLLPCGVPDDVRVPHALELEYEPIRDGVLKAVLDKDIFYELYAHEWTDLEIRRRHFQETWRDLFRNSYYNEED